MVLIQTNLGIVIPVILSSEHYGIMWDTYSIVKFRDDAKFTLYEDDNETYDYEKGEYATYDLVWNDAQHTLTVGRRKGDFPGMVTERRLNIVLAVPGKNAGIDSGVANVKTVRYTGQPVQVEF